MNNCCYFFIILTGLFELIDQTFLPLISYIILLSKLITIFTLQIRNYYIHLVFVFHPNIIIFFVFDDHFLIKNWFTINLLGSFIPSNFISNLNEYFYFKYIFIIIDNTKISIFLLLKYSILIKIVINFI